MAYADLAEVCRRAAGCSLSICSSKRTVSGEQSAPGLHMKFHLVSITVLAVAACSPSKAPTPTAPATETAAPRVAVPISLAGQWAGTITCYKIESPLQMTINAAKPGEAVMSKGEGGVVSWPATVAVNNAARMVTVRSTGAADGAERIEGLLSADGGTISGEMDKQLCTAFTLKRTG